MTSEKVLELENLAVSFMTSRGEVQAVRGVNLTVNKGEILCIVGESGCGKTVMCQSVMHLLPRYTKIKSGRITTKQEASRIEFSLRAISAADIFVLKSCRRSCRRVTFTDRGYSSVKNITDR